MTGISGVLRRLSEGASLRPLDAPEHGPLATPDAALTSLLDLGGTVRLADHLNTRRGRKLEGRHAPTSPLRGSLARKVSDVRDESGHAFDHPFTGRRALPDANAVARVLAQHGALESRDPTAILEAARTLAAQSRERFDHQFSKGRQRIRWIRTDVAAELRSLGPRAAMLEVFDAVLSRSIEVGFSKLHDQLAGRLDDIFIARFSAAVRAIPEGETDVGSLFAPSGMMTRHGEELGALLVALLENELDAVLALVDTAYALRQQEALA